MNTEIRPFRDPDVELVLRTIVEGTAAEVDEGFFTSGEGALRDSRDGVRLGDGKRGG